MLWCITILAAVVGLYYLLSKPYKYWPSKGVKQGNPIPFFGDSLSTVLRTQSFAEVLHSFYNLIPGSRYIGLYRFTSPALLVKDPDLIKQITVKDFDHFTDHQQFVPEDADPLWNKNLFTLKGKRWRDMRATLSPSFTSGKIRNMFVLISESAENFINFFIKNDEELVEIEMKDTFTRFANDVIATTAFGIQVDSLTNKNNEFYLMGKEATNFAGFGKILKFVGFILIPGIIKFFKITLMGQKVNDFFIGLITETIKTREKNNIVRHDMINLLMEARKSNDKIEEAAEILDTGFATVQESEIGKAKGKLNIDDVDIAAQATIFFFAGFETVSALMCFMSYELAANPDIQNRLRNEVNETFKECGGTLTYEAIIKMKYMDLVVSETLRKWPSTVAMDRLCTKPYTIEPVNPDEHKVHLEKGNRLLISVFAIHHDPEFYPDPDRFDPERFNDENKGNIKPYTYIPFGSGPRNCIGSRFALLETKVIFFHILRNFEIVPTQKSKIPLQLSKKTFNLTAEGGFWFGFKRINPQK